MGSSYRSSNWGFMFNTQPKYALAAGPIATTYELSIILSIGTNHRSYDLVKG